MQSNIARMLAVSVTATLGACSGTTSDAIPPTCNSTSSASEHLYVVNGTGELRQFVLPLTSTSIPSVDFFDSIKHDAVAVDSNGNIATADITEGGVTVYDAPISCLSKASATFSDTTRRGDLVFNAAGDLFAIGQYEIDLHKPPFSSATSVSQTVDSITPGGLYGVSFVGAAMVASGNLYSSVLAQEAGSKIQVYGPPSSSETGASPLLDYLQDIAVSKARLFTRQDTGVAVFDLPITESSEASFIIPLRPPCEGKGFAVDSHGNLYVGCPASGTFLVFAPPFSASSAPTVTLTTTVRSHYTLGIAIGNDRHKRSAEDSWRGNSALRFGCKPPVVITFSWHAAGYFW